MRKYRIKDARMAASDTAKVGDIVYGCKYYDYGLSSDDSRRTGIEHVSVTFNENGDYPTFTIPEAALERLE